jgi:hypothetical protein
MLRRILPSLGALSLALAIPGVVPEAAASASPPTAPTSGFDWTEPYPASGAAPAGALLPATLGLPNGAAPLAPPANATRYVSVQPARLLDTRRAIGFSRALNANETIDLVVAGTSAVPTGATAVVLNLTITGALSGGYVTAYPAGQPRPDVSAINVERPGQTIANLVTVPLGVGGAVSLFTSAGTHLIADAQGYYVPAGTATAGRLVPAGPTRLVDTRTGVGGLSGRLTAGADVEINIAGLAAVPVDVDSAVLKVTVTDAVGAGYWSLYPAGTARPDASNLNVEFPGQTMASQAIVRLTNGRLRVFAETGGHLLIDFVGYFTGVTAPTATTGLFVPVNPGRVLDTRQGFLRPGEDRSLEVPVAGRFNLPTGGIAAVVLNTTATDASAGFVAVWPARQYRPNASSLNASADGQTIASHVITPVTAAGFAVYTEHGAHLIADISGWFTGDPVVATVGAMVPLAGSAGPAVSTKFDYYRKVRAGVGATSVEGTLPGDVPIRWNPCTPIRYVVNLNGYADRNLIDIDEALDRMTAATGITFLNVGTSTYIPTRSRPTDLPQSQALTRTGPYDLLIALGAISDSDLLGSYTLGIAGPSWVTSRGVTSYVHAAALFNMDLLDGVEPWSSEGLGPVMLHEMGHVIGLGHFEDETQIMNPYATSVTAYADGDLRGLWEEGSSRGCI